MTTTPQPTLAEGIERILADVIMHGYNDGVEGLKDPTEMCMVWKMGNIIIFQESYIG